MIIMFKTIKIEGSFYRVSLEVATRIEHLQRIAMVYKADGNYGRYEKCQEDIYDIMDRALFDKEAYEIDESEVA